MKRPLVSEESDESRSKSRRLSEFSNPVGTEEVQDDEDSRGGFLDLNATPSDFDLNAPLTEEDSSIGQSNWPPDTRIASNSNDAENQEKVGTAELALPSHGAIDSGILADGGVQADEAAVFVEIFGQEQELAKAEDSASSIVGLEAGKTSKKRGVGDIQADESMEASEEPELRDESPTAGLSSLAAAILRRSLESAFTLGIDDELDVIKGVWSAHQQRDVVALDNVVSASCEELAKHPSNPSRYHYTSCLYISKKLPEAFGLVNTSQVLVKILRNAASGHPSGKRQMMLPVLASKLLMRAFAAEPDWPLDFVQVYLEDAIASRTWIEHEGCKEFVANILTAFPNVDAELSGNTDESTSVKEGQGISGEALQGQPIKSESASSQPQGQGTTGVKSRFLSAELRARIREEFLNALHQLLGSANTKDNPRQLLKLLRQGAGYEEVRVAASSMLEGYLNNPVHLRAAKAVLDRILLHTRSTTENDLKTVSNLLMLRISSMQPAGQNKSLFGNIFGEMITTLVKRRSEYSTLALRTFVTAEVNNRNPHNLRSLVIVMKAMPEIPPPESELAVILQELIGSDDYRLQLRDFIRRMMKQVGPEIDVHALCHGLMQPWPSMGEQHEALKEAWLKQVVDLVCQLLLHAAAFFAQDDNLVSAVTASSSPGAPAGSSSSSLKEKLVHLEKLSMDTASFQVEAVAWCTDVLSVCAPSMGESQFSLMLRKLLFLEGPEAYVIGSDSASEIEALSFRLVSSCLPAPEEILARIILMAISNYPVSQGEALKLIERLIWRAASWKVHSIGALTADNMQLPAAIFKLASFNLPGVTRQAVAQLVVKDMYWRACLVVLIIAAYNPTTIGAFVWNNIPTVRCLMEALLTCTRTFVPITADQSTVAELSKLELEAEFRDSKAEEAISAFLDVAERRRDESLPGTSDAQGGSLPSPPVSRVSKQAGEWKGKVMFINPVGPVRWPPKSAVDELDRIDNLYGLGHLLRQSREPDFLAEITKQQTLRQAWPWLQKILVQAPDVITYLPSVWQCELLFMHIGKHPRINALSLDIGNVCTHLQQVMSQKVRAAEGEIESVVDFLSEKLISKSGSVRVRGRQCFWSLVEAHASQPLSASPDVKKSDVQGLAGTTVKGQHYPSSGDNAQGLPRKLSGILAMASQSSSSNAPGAQMPSGVLRGSPGVAYQPAANENMHGKVAMSSTGDHYVALKALESLPTASRVLKVLAPAIQKAIERENSFAVVLGYLEFLGRHLSDTSLAICLATFVVQRKMMAARLFFGPSRPGMASEDSEWTDQKTHSIIINLLLESLCKALEAGTVADITWDEMGLIHSPVVDLLLPLAAEDGKHVTFVPVKIHKIVVEAALETLACLTQGKLDEKVEPQFLKLLDLLFPILDNSDQPGDVVIPIGWLEDWNGEKSILVSESQALRFMRSDNARLVKAGLSVLSLKSKLSVCEALCLSAEGATALLSDLDRFEESEFEALTGSLKFSGQRLKKLKNCLRTLVQVDGVDSDRSFLKAVEQPKVGNVGAEVRLPLLLASGGGIAEASFILQNRRGPGVEGPDQPIEKVAAKALNWLSTLKTKEEAAVLQDSSESSGIAGYYVSLRLSLQAALIGDEIQSMAFCLNKILSVLENVPGDSPDAVRLLALTIPVLTLLCYRKPSISLRKSDLLLVTRIAISLKAKVEGEEHSRASRAFRLALRVFGGLVVKLVDAVSPELFLEVNADVPTSLRQSLDIVEDKTPWDLSVAEHENSFAVLKVAPADRIEKLLRCFLRTELSHIWRKSSWPGSRSTAELSRVLLNLLKDWMNREKKLGGESGLRSSAAQEQIEFGGRCSLVMEMLEVLDPEFQSQDLLQSSLDVQQPAGLSAPYFPLLALSGVVHKSSWQTLWRTLKLVLEQGGSSNAAAIQFVRSGDISSNLEGGGNAVVEFISLCVRHPRTKLACRNMTDEKQAGNAMWSWLDPSTAGILTKQVVSATVDAMQNAGIVLKDVESSDEPVKRVDHQLRRQDLTVHCRCLKLLLSAASQGPHVARAIIHHLESYQQGDFREGLNLHPSPMAVAENFLRGLYRAFPVTVKEALRSSSSKFFQLEERMLRDIQGTEGQTCSLDTVVHCALRSVCHRNEKESNAAYGFCLEFSRQHPLLVIPHLPTLAVLLKELLPLLKQTDPQARATLARAFQMGLGLLDALRPYVILISNSSYKKAQAQMHFHEVPQHVPFDSATPKTNLEAILDSYFQIVSGVDSQDRLLVANVVARFSDFLCHCVAAGGRIRVYISGHRTPTLETVAQTFSKLRKIGFLLSLLDKPEVDARDDELPQSVLTAHPPQLGVSSDQAATSLVILDDILKVRGQLQQCIKLNTAGQGGKGVSTLYTAQRSSRRFSQVFSNIMDENSLTSTLNDLERASARMPTILPILEDSLIQLMEVHDVSAREHIYSLLERSLVHCLSESSASNIIQGLLQQLRSASVLHAKSAARFASRFFHFCPELQPSILVEMLQLGKIASDELQLLMQDLFSVAGCPSL